MQHKTKRPGTKIPQAAKGREPGKHMEPWWLKYEAAGDLAAEFPTPPTLVLSMLNSVHAHWRNRGDTSVNMREDLRHHIAVQKVFKKWRGVHGARV
ncbi:hypothetical protein HUU05_07580 [candidate division KSB1 bacterium]|nr:hypothetical protein [candidate division KSB1 bacterium]